MSTPRTEAARFKSEPDCYGQTGWLVWASHAEEMETELQAARELVRRLYTELCCFDCDDRGQDLKLEVKTYLEL